MSGVEIIGLILGGLPLVISAAEDYRRGFEPFLKWRRYKREFRSFINSVSVEKQIFSALLRRLVEYSDIPLDDRELLLTGTDPEAWHSENIVKALKVRLGDSYVSCMYILKTMEEDLLELQKMMSLKDGSVDWAKPGEDKWNYQRKRIAHSFGHKGAETVASLERSNRKLRELLDLLDSQLVDGKVSKKKAVSKDTTWAKFFEIIRKYASSLHAALKNGWKCNCMVPHLAALQLQERDRDESSACFTMTFMSSNSSKTSSSLRRVVITINNLNSAKNTANTRPQPTPVQESYLDKLIENIESESPTDAKKKAYSKSSNTSSMFSKYSSGISFTKSDSAVTVSSLQSGNGTEIMIEESHTKSWSTGRKSKMKKTVRMNVEAEAGRTENSSTVVTTSTISVAQPMCTPPPVNEEIAPSEVKILDLCRTLAMSEENEMCLGYLSDEEHMRHELRSIKDGTLSAQTCELISLETLLANHTRSKLSRKQRYRLAVVLASSILQLQTTPWLTEQLEKRNIFFYRNGSDIVADQPYIRHSFPSKKIFSKTNPEESTQPAPPSSVRYSTRNSLVHLGILLLELCFGQPIEKQTELRNPYLMDGKAHNDTDYLTARDWIYEVEEEAGVEFESAVKCCVQCNFDAKLDWTDTNFTQSVYAAVVEPLEKAYGRFESV